MEDSVIIGAIKEIGAIVTPIALAWIAMLQIKLAKKHEELRKEVNGKMTTLLDVSGKKERAEGKAEGKLEQRVEDMAIAAVKAAPLVQDVNIVDQDKIIKVQPTSGDL